jgi:protein SPT2
MSSYAQLKEMALRKAEEEQASLNREREHKEREAAAKRAAREAQEREQKERERKILVQRMARQKEEETRERLRKEQASKLRNETIATDDPIAKPKLAGGAGATLSRPDADKLKKPGSTWRENLSGQLKANSNSNPVARRKRKVDEDDFVGNRFDKPSRKSSSSASASSSASKRKPVPLTREEKQAMRRAREFGSLPRLPPISRVGATPSTSRSNSSINTSDASANANRTSARAHLAKENGLVALGTKKRDHRSIDEIERDLRRQREEKEQSKKEGMSEAERERQAALLRRQRAMEGKRKSDQQDRERQAAKNEAENGDGSDSKEDLYGSEDDRPSRSRASQQKAAKTNGLPSIPKRPTNVGAPPTPAQPKEPKPLGGRAAGGIDPADFLPGAPLRPEVMARLTEKAKSASGRGHAARSPERDAAPQAKRVAAEARTSPAAPSPPASAPPRRETARDRFIREQEEKKKKLAAGGSDRRDELRRSGSPDEYESEEEYDEDEYESDGMSDDEAGGGGASYRDEIWKIFGKDRKKYASRMVDSDDDMEADAGSVLQEELRSARQAREEDLREEQREKEREREKMLRKQAHKRASGR